MYLIDTMVLSETFKRQPNPRAIAWLRRVPSADAFISVLSIGEIERGIAREHRRNRTFADRLLAWLDQVLTDYRDRILVADIAVARRWGRLSQQVGHSGTDLLIAATALEHGLIVATRNRRHFEHTGVEVLNPYEMVTSSDA
jgi:predicted nucleic acid-binding protein